MYHVQQKDKIIGDFKIFADAWLYAKLELTTFSTIIGPDGFWKINPFLMN